MLRGTQGLAARFTEPDDAKAILPQRRNEGILHAWLCEQIGATELKLLPHDTPGLPATYQQTYIAIEHHVFLFYTSNL